MPQRTGGQTIADLLENRFQSVLDYGESRLAEVIANDLAALQRTTAWQLSNLCEITADKQRISGYSSDMTMEEGTEYARGTTQRVTGGGTLGFPLRLHVIALGWTRKWLQTHTVAELAEQVEARKMAYQRRLSREVKRAVYGSANYTFRDELMAPQADIAVKAFANADSFPVPNGPNGETFDASTHTHYTAAASLVAADYQSSIDTVVEHGHGSGVISVIAQANEAAFKALSGFTAAQAPYLTLGQDDTRLEQPRLDITRMNDRFIGFFGAAEVWVKPWAVAGYVATFATGGGRKPLACRTRDGKAPTLAVVAEIDAHPLHAQHAEAEFGVGVNERTKGAVHQFTNGTYQNPTITD